MLIDIGSIIKAKETPSTQFFVRVEPTAKDATRVGFRGICFICQSRVIQDWNETAGWTKTTRRPDHDLP